MSECSGDCGGTSCEFKGGVFFGFIMGALAVLILEKIVGLFA